MSTLGTSVSSDIFSFELICFSSWHNFAVLRMKNTNDFEELPSAQKIVLLEQYVAKLVESYKKNPLAVLQNLIAETTSTSFLNKAKNIGIFYPRFYDGGVERVISLQIPMFLRLGFNIVLITEESRPEFEFPLPAEVKRRSLAKKLKDGRARELGKILLEENVDVYIHHAATSQTLIWDLVVAKFLKKKTIVCRHEIPGSNLLQGIQARRLQNILLEPLIYQLANRLVVLGKMEEEYFRSQGVKATFIPNPRTFEFSNNPHNLLQPKKKIIWVGRLDQTTKNYKSALEIMALVLKQERNAECHLIGPSSDPTSRDFIEEFISNNELSGKLIWHGRCNNVEEFYKSATVHLMTSYVESFPMVIVESKSCGLPLVLFDLNHLTLLKDKKGFISVSQDDIKNCTDAILRIIRTPELEKKLSEEAFNSINSFYKNYKLEDLWSDIILDKYTDFSPQSKEFSDFIKLQNRMIRIGLTNNTSKFSIDKLRLGFSKNLLRVKKKINAFF